MTPAQCRAARNALGWTHAKMAEVRRLTIALLLASTAAADANGLMWTYLPSEKKAGDLGMGP
jgi:hypothetical protein